MIYARALGAALDDCLAADERVVLLGEDIADPYGGAFKVTRGLSTTHGADRVRTTPISEAAITGIGAGLALAGYRPIAEIMFGDFLSLCFDQLANHAAKYQAMYGGTVSCPLVVRSPSGGGRGYGPTHSQSLEKHFLGVPHLRVVAASLHHDPSRLLASFLSGDEPVLHVEHKLLYPLEMAPPVDGSVDGAEATWEAGSGASSTLSLRWVPRSRCRATVVAYGYQAELARRVQRRLAVEEELFVELLVPAQLSPLDVDPVVRSAAATCSLVTVEEGTAGWSWGSELSHRATQALYGGLRRAPAVVASRPTVIPGARDLERDVVVGEDAIESALRKAAA